MREHWEPLSGGSRVLVSGDHTFGTDALLLADFSMPGAGSAARTSAPAAG